MLKGEGSLMNNVKRAAEAIVSIILESDIQRAATMPLGSSISTALFATTSVSLWFVNSHFYLALFLCVDSHFWVMFAPS